MTDKVKAALALDKLSLHHRISFNPTDAYDFLYSTDVIYRENLSGLIKDIDLLIPTMKFGEGNPSNGKKHHHYLIGRENSRVIYIEIIGSYLDTNFSIGDLTENIRKLSKFHEADEFTGEADKDRNVLYRLWWD